MARAKPNKREVNGGKLSRRVIVGEAPAHKPPSALLIAAIAAALALIAAYIVYAPSLSGDFVFDDRTLPMFDKNTANAPLQRWLGTRALLMTTYYLNYHTSGMSPLAYHAVNVFLHTGCAVMIFFVVMRILEWASVSARPRKLASVFCAGLFLLHPVQTESVSYIASRSENLSVLLFLIALALFLYRPNPQVTFTRVAAILTFYLLAMTSKEHTAVLPAVLLLTDYAWNPGFSFAGIRRNWKLYVPVSVAAALGIYLFSRYINKGSNIGFSLEGITWYQYLFTEFRAIFVYLRLFVLPVGQNVDYNFPVSHDVLEHGALFYGVTLIAISVAAVVYRRRFPLAFYGWFLTLILLAPTSSFVPIKDTLTERRMYLPFIGYLLILCEAVLRFRWRRAEAMAAIVCVLAAMSFLTWKRNETWVGMESLWRDSVETNPQNARALMGLGDAVAARSRCAEAILYFDRALKLDRSYQLVYNLASARDCANQFGPAVSGYEDAIAMRPTAEAWANLGLVQMKRNKFSEAYDAFDRAQKLDPTLPLTYDYRGILNLAESKFMDAVGQFQIALQLNPSDSIAPRGIARAAKHERQF